VEDHPLDHIDFEGEFPNGEYGAGRVLIWDKGSYTLLEKDENKISFSLILLSLFRIVVVAQLHKKYPFLYAWPRPLLLFPQEELKARSDVDLYVPLIKHFPEDASLPLQYFDIAHKYVIHIFM